MKLLTLNTHSLIEQNYQRKLLDFVRAVSMEKPEIIALQEVNQTISAKAVEGRINEYFPCRDNITIRSDNHVFNAAQLLCKNGVDYYWTYLPIKNGYGRFEEGLAIMSLNPIIETEIITVSGIDDYNNWKTRKLIGIRTQNYPDEWFFSVHYGWWDDEEEPFAKQWQKTDMYMKKHNRVWLMGDFNNASDVANQGYDIILNSGWYDSYTLAENKDNGVTVAKAIDGWKDKVSIDIGMRIDQIWCSQKASVESSKVVFNGINYPIVSDHYGVVIDYDRGD